MWRIVLILSGIYAVLGAAAFALAWVGLTGTPRSPLHSLYGLLLALPWTTFAGHVSAPENDSSNLAAIAFGVAANTCFLLWLAWRLSLPGRFRIRG